MDKTYGRIRIGIIVRDNKGAVLATRNTTNYVLAEPAIAEVLVSYHAANFSREMGFYDII